jgi:hypothetical protein
MRPSWASQGVAMEEYLTVQARNSASSSSGNGTEWDRRYLTLSTADALVMYSSRQEYRRAPRPVYTRPIQLSDFLLLVNNSQSQGNHSQGNHSQGTQSEGSQAQSPFDAPSFQMTLVPRESGESPGGQGKQWVLRCDTEEELGIWFKVVREVCPGILRY